MANRFNLKKRDGKVFLLLALLTGSVTVLVSYLIAGQFFNVISTFGVNESTSFVFNLGLIVTGIFLILFWRNYLQDKPKIKLGLKTTVFILAQSLIFVGLFPTLPDSPINTMHWIAALLFLYVYPIILIYTARELNLLNQFFGGLLFLLNFAITFFGFILLGQNSSIFVPIQFVQIAQIVIFSLIFLLSKRK